MAARIRAHDWAGTPLGPVEDWPQAVRTMLEIALATDFAMALYIGPQLRMLFNDAFIPVLGKRHSMALGSPAAAVWAEVWEQIAPLLHGVLERGEARSFNGAEFLLEAEPGRLEPRYFDGCWSPVADSAGHTVALLAVIRETTEHVRAGQDLRQLLEKQQRTLAALRDSEERYRLLVESAKDFVIVGMDATGRITSWNTGAERLMGYPEAEAVGQPAALCFTPEDRATGAPEQELALARQTGRAENERWHQRKDGSRFWGSGFVVPQADDPRRGFLKIFRDRTAEQLAEREREQLVAALREADARKNEFLATLAHELRNPLAPLRNVASLLKRSGPTAAQAPLVAIMERQVGQLRRLVDDLLEIGRITQGKIVLRREPMRVSAAVYAALEAIQPIVEQRGQAFEARVSSRALVDIDAARITQVITNLLNNAAKFTAEGGRITLEAFDEPDAVIVRVRDEGIGIAPEVLPRVFDLFAQGAATTTDQAQAGLGIGLSLVKRLVELHGGGVQAESAGPGRGATFTVRLPRVDQATDTR